MPGPEQDLIAHLGRLTRQVARERGARLQAEELLEQKSLELYEINQSLLTLNAELEQRVQIRTSDLDRERRRAVTLAERDMLTGLANRARFQAHFEAVISNCITTGEAAALLLIDLDHFKQVNDRLGHRAGDALLIQVAERLRHVCRDTDLVARLGGDEFAVVLQAPENGLDSGTSLATRICQAVKIPYEVEGVLIEPSCSIGIAVVPDHGIIGTDLLRYADLALYSTKENGRAGAAVFEQQMFADFEDRTELEEDLRAAIAQGQISVWFQPIVELRTGRIVAAEALARWFHPKRGMIPPDRFIKIAEQRGLINELGRRILTAACERALPVLQNGRLRRISVNVSPLQMLNTDIVDHVFSTIKRLGIQPSQLVLEVTESVMLTDHPTVHKSFDTLREGGIRLALDDFGAGYSNLGYLTQLRVDMLKIDRAFVSDLADKFATGAMIRSITALARELNVQVVVEGVETPRQHELIASFGCDYGQGYLFSKPLTPDDLISLLESDPTIAAPSASVDA